MKKDLFPKFLYGTAWKEDRTAGLVLLALKSGFRGIDTACQRKHYFEQGVGQGLSEAYALGITCREDLFLQTKFTYQAGQDHRLPYDPEADLSVQVRQSVEKSLENLGTDHLDSYILHGPIRQDILSPEDLEVWTEMEKLQKEGITNYIGVSNISHAQLKQLYSRAQVKPAFVQNRCYARTFWDRDVRNFCTKNGIVYQGFSLLTANRIEIGSDIFSDIAARYQRSPSQVVFRFARQLGMLPLTGTTSAEHMVSDLDIDGFELCPDDVQKIEEISRTIP